MKTLRRLVLTVALLAASASYAVDASGSFEQTKPVRIAVVDFKTCVEKSKMGQKEQTHFEAMKKQMEAILVEKEKSLTDVATKFNDIDYLDSLSPDAEAELKRQFRNLNQEFSQQQNQFYQTLSQTNLLIVQKLNEAVAKASETVAKRTQIDLVLNEESCFFNAAALDISPMVIRVMDENFEKEGKDSKPAAEPVKK